MMLQLLDTHTQGGILSWCIHGVPKEQVWKNYNELVCETMQIHTETQIPTPSSASTQALYLHSASMKCSPSTLPFAAKPAAEELTNQLSSWNEGQVWTKVLEITRINSDTRQCDLYDMRWEKSTPPCKCLTTDRLWRIYSPNRQDRYSVRLSLKVKRINCWYYSPERELKSWSHWTCTPQYLFS